MTLHEKKSILASDFYVKNFVKNISRNSSDERSDLLETLQTDI